MHAVHTLQSWQEDCSMATLTVRNVKEYTKQALRLRAARKGISVEQEVRSILDRAADEPVGENDEPREGASLYEAIRNLVESYGGFEIELPERGPPRDPPTFE
jgi:plasmid stability protein